jgi:hypothetical protein
MRADLAELAALGAACKKRSGVPAESPPALRAQATGGEEAFIEKVKQRPAWQRVAFLGYCPKGDDGSYVSKMFAEWGGDALLRKLHSDDPEEALGAQRFMLTAEAGIAFMLSKRLDVELAARLGAEDIGKALPTLHQLLDLKMKLTAIQQSSLRTATALRQGPLHLLLKNTGPTQVNLDVSGQKPKGATQNADSTDQIERL